MLLAALILSWLKLLSSLGRLPVVKTLVFTIFGYVNTYLLKKKLYIFCALFVAHSNPPHNITPRDESLPNVDFPIFPSTASNATSCFIQLVACDVSLLRMTTNGPKEIV